MGTNYVKKSRTVRLPIATSTKINQFSNGASTERGSYILNGIILKYPDEKLYVTQRPTITSAYDPDDIPITVDRGRGIYYWDDTGVGQYVEETYWTPETYAEGSDTPALFIVNGPEIYKGSYATVTTGATITTGTTRLYMAELGADLVFADPENNEMWYVSTGTATVLKTMTFAAVTESCVFADANPDTITTTSTWSPLMVAGDVFKVSGTTLNEGTYTVASHSGTLITLVAGDALAAETISCTLTPYGALPQNNSRSLAHGIVTLDQTMYVLATDGTVWGSTIGNAKKWTDALNVITAEREEDQGVFITKHFEHIVIFGRRTIEFMYDAGNPTGSPLAVRQDIAYNVGCADPNSVWRYEDEVYFLGRNASGQVQVYRLKDFKIEPISTSTLSTFFTQTGYTYVGSGFQAGGNTFYVLSVGDSSSGDMVSKETHVYNATTNSWTEWDYSGADPDKFPMISATSVGVDSTGYGQFTNGLIFTLTDTLVPSEDSVDLTMTIRSDHFDADSRDWKYAHQLRFVGDATAASQNITIKWADDSNASYSTGRTIDISNSNNKLTRLGRFKSRSHQVDYSGSEQIRIEGLDLDVSEGTH